MEDERQGSPSDSMHGRTEQKVRKKENLHSYVPVSTMKNGGLRPCRVFLDKLIRKANAKETGKEKENR